MACRVANLPVKNFVAEFGGLLARTQHGKVRGRCEERFDFLGEHSDGMGVKRWLQDGAAIPPIHLPTHPPPIRSGERRNSLVDVDPPQRIPRCDCCARCSLPHHRDHGRELPGFVILPRNRFQRSKRYGSIHGQGALREIPLCIHSHGDPIHTYARWFIVIVSAVVFQVASFSQTFSLSYFPLPHNLTPFTRTLPPTHTLTYTQHTHTPHH